MDAFKNSPLRFTSPKRIPRNPGCTYCRFFIAPSDALRADGACVANARSVSKKKNGMTYTKWIECENPKHKNRINRCNDFVLQNVAWRLIRLFFQNRIIPLTGFKKKSVFEPAAYIDEDWQKN